MTILAEKDRRTKALENLLMLYLGRDRSDGTELKYWVSSTNTVSISFARPVCAEEISALMDQLKMAMKYCPPAPRLTPLEMTNEALQNAGLDPIEDHPELRSKI